MDVNAKIGIDSKRTTAASVAIVGVVVYLALVHLKPILMPLAMAVLLYFLIKPPEQYIYAKVGNRFVSYGTVIPVSYTHLRAHETCRRQRQMCIRDSGGVAVFPHQTSRAVHLR